LETLSGWGEAKGAAFIITPIDLRGGRGHLFLEVAAPSALPPCYNWSATTAAYEFPNKTSYTRLTHWPQVFTNVDGAVYY